MGFVANAGGCALHRVRGGNAYPCGIVYANKVLRPTSMVHQSRSCLFVV